MPASIDQQWKPEEDQKLRQMITDGQSLKHIASVFGGRSRRAIECRTYTLGLKSGTPRTIHSKKEDFWETPNPLNCYFAGIAAADMSVGKRRSTLAWACEVTDEPSMVLFKKATEFTGSIGYVTKKSPSSDNMSTLSVIRFCACQKWCTDLANNFNVIPDKCHRLQPPNLSTDLLKCCYLIGYTDGDGCIHASASPQIRFVSASVHIIQWIQQFVEAHFPFQIRKKTKSVGHSLGNTYHTYCVYGMTAIKLFEFLRKIDVPKFSRKWDNPNFLRLVAAHREKWPSFFTPDKEPFFDSAGNIALPAHSPATQHPLSPTFP